MLIKKKFTIESKRSLKVAIDIFLLRSTKKNNRMELTPAGLAPIECLAIKAIRQMNLLSPLMSKVPNLFSLLD
jgi:hypothetical protein